MKGQWPFAVTRSVLASLMLIGVMAVEAAATECDDPAIRPLEGPAGFQLRLGDTRCEGFYESPVSGRALEVLSATIGTAPEPMPKRLKLLVPGATAFETVQIRAEGLQPRLYYRMTAEIIGDRIFSWPLDQVLAAEGLDLGAVGIVAIHGADDEETILPVAFEGGSGATRLTVRSFVPLDLLVWRLTPEGMPEGAWQEVPDSLVGAGEVRTIAVEGAGAGLLALRGRRAGTNDWVALDVPIRLPAP